MLFELRDTGVLMSYPDPRHDRTDQPPYRIGLTSWATDVAADLHCRFGDGVDLRVGALGYPDPWAVGVPRIEATQLLDPAEGVVELDGPREVRSGDVLRTGLRIANVSKGKLTINTNGQLTALVILDPGSGDVVGGYWGGQTLPGVRFEVLPGDRTTIPLLVGTESFVPELGYRVPAGVWEVAADLRLGDGRVVRSVPVPLAITSRLKRGCE